jgi:hypothetical protein
MNKLVQETTRNIQDILGMRGRMCLEGVTDKRSYRDDDIAVCGPAQFVVMVT